MESRGAKPCPACGAAAEQGQRFCRACGKPLGEAARKPAVGQTVDRPPDPRAEKVYQPAVPAPSAAPRPALPRVDPIDLSPALPPPLPPRRAGTAPAALAPLAVVLFIGLLAGAYRFMVLPTLQTAQRLKEKSLAQLCERAAWAELVQRDYSPMVGPPDTPKVTWQETKKTFDVRGKVTVGSSAPGGMSAIDYVCEVRRTPVRGRPRSEVVSLWVGVPERR